jgi:protein N-terminal amidase
MVVSPEGELVFNYRKTFLYDTDKNWAIEGNEFGSFEILGKRIGLGICMDINNKDFKSEWTNYEFATFNVEKKNDIVILCSNWLEFEDGIKNI